MFLLLLGEYKRRFHCGLNTREGFSIKIVQLLTLTKIAAIKTCIVVDFITNMLTTPNYHQVIMLNIEFFFLQCFFVVLVLPGPLLHPLIPPMSVFLATASADQELDSKAISENV